MNTCPKCHRPLNEGNSPNLEECHGDEYDNECALSAIIHTLRSQLEGLSWFADSSPEDARQPKTVIPTKTLDAIIADLERERMRLAACGVVALADTPDSAKEVRNMHPDYMSASCNDVARRVDECIALRTENAELQKKYDQTLNDAVELARKCNELRFGNDNNWMSSPVCDSGEKIRDDFLRSQFLRNQPDPLPTEPPASNLYSGGSQKKDIENFFAE